MFYNRLLALSLLAYLPFNSFAAPTINTSINASGLNQGDILVINGTGFGAKSEAKPLLWADFNEQFQPSSKGRRTSWNSTTIPTIRELSTAMSAPNATQALRFNHAASSDAVLGLHNIRNSSGQRTQNLYMFVRKLYAYDIVEDKRPPDSQYPDGTFNLKTYRFWGDINGSGNIGHNTIYWGYQGAFGYDEAATVTENTEGGVKYSSELLHQKDTWLTQELVYDAGTLGNKDGLFDIYQDGKKWLSETYNFITHNANHPHKYEDFFFDQVSNGTDAGPNYVYYDEIYMDTSLQRVVICDAELYANCSKRAIQIPTAWTDSSISIELNLGEFSHFGKPLWLYVFDEQGNANITGVPIVCDNCIDDSLCFTVKDSNNSAAVICL
ncbi:MAG: hypothetical protein ACRBHB_10435 [Arenicella sp.]